MTRPISQRPWQRIKPAILQRDHYQCQLRLPGCTMRATTVDHLWPRALGGPDFDPANLVAACRHCNSSKGARIQTERRQSRRW